MLDDEEPVPEALMPFVIVKPLKDETVTIVEAAARLNVPRPTIYQWVDRGKLLA